VAKDTGVGLYPSPMGGVCGPGRGLFPSQEKNANYTQKMLNLVHIFVYFSYFKIIVDSNFKTSERSCSCSLRQEIDTFGLGTPVKGKGLA